MAWRPTVYLIEGELDNTTPCKVTGWMKFAGIKEKVTFELNGDFHRDIRGAKIRFRGNGKSGVVETNSYMEGFALHQTGKVGDMTAGLPPQDYVGYPYLEWYGDSNGRVAIELQASQIEVIGTPIPANETEPVSRKEQFQNLTRFARECAKEIGLTA